ncbi:hypothetical protein LC040_00140 [Bacillus tianshenii]|nr:hypothetical protein LC040_00140 [Bacillus tianshenii]
MFPLFKKRKKVHAPTFTNQEIKKRTKPKKNINISVSSFVADTKDPCNLNDQKEMLELALYLINKYIPKPSEQDVVTFLHPNVQSLRKKILNELHVEKQHILHDLSNLRHVIQRTNDEKKKEKYRTLKQKVDETIDPYIVKLNRYDELFANAETKDNGYQTFHNLFEYLGNIEEKETQEK